MPRLEHLLRALRYPRLELFSLRDETEIVMLVAFLEDRYVRMLPIEARVPLRTAGGSWGAAFRQYLCEAGCPLISEAHPYNGENLADYVQWLVLHAVSLQFEDRTEEINNAAAAEMAAASCSSVHHVMSPVEVPPEAATLIRELAALTRVTVDSRDPFDTLQAVHRIIRQRIVPAAAAADAEEAKACAGVSIKRGGSVKMRRQTTPGELLDLSTFPLGFESGDAIVDRAASILRMLYVSDLRELQDAVNDILVTVQEFTANPRTDASLGVVGR